jgi:hypothetical protein
MLVGQLSNFLIEKTFGLVHVNPGSKITVKICRANVKLTHVHLSNNNYGKEHLNRVMLDDWAEMLV